MSISSSLITNITTWRNPQGEQGNWEGREHKYVHLPSLKKIAISEAAFAAIGLAALVESAMNAAFILFSLPFLWADSRSAQLPIERLKSTAFAAGWCAVNLALNLGVANLTTREETARASTTRVYQSFVKQFA